MSKIKSEITTLVGELSLDLDDLTTVSVFFDDVIEMLAYAKKPPFLGSTYYNLSSSVKTYNYGSTMLRMVHMMLGGKCISEETESHLDAYYIDWRTQPGIPVIFYQDKLNRQFSLFPIPNFDSGDRLTVIYAEDKSTNISDYYALPIAMLTLAKEFTRSDTNQDPDFAAQCEALGSLMLKMMGHHGISRNKNHK